MKSALVTGGSRGIGFGIATRLAELGYGLTITARGEKVLEDVGSQLLLAGAPDVVTIAQDLADTEAADRIVAAHAARFGAMNVLVLNAGVGTAGSIAEFPMRRFHKTVDVNLRAPFQLLQTSMPLLRKVAEKEPAKGAKVIAVSSISGVYAEAGLAAYGATKAAILSLIDTLNAEESHNGITGTAIAPAYVDTAMSDWTKDKIPAEAMLSVDDLVGLIEGVVKLSSRAVVSRIVMTRAGAGLTA